MLIQVQSNRTLSLFKH